MSADLLPGAERHEVAVNGVRFTLHRAEPARKRRTTPVLLLHGLPQTPAVWRHLLPELARDRTVLAPDLKGLGTSEHRPPYDVETLVHELAALAAHEVDQSFDVVGHGIGGTLAIELAASRPELVRRLVIVSSAHRWMEGPRALAGLLMDTPALPELVLSLAAPAVVTGAMRFGWRSEQALAPRYLQHYVTAYRHPARIEALVAYCRAVDDLRREVPHPGGPAVALPPAGRVTADAALVVWGTADPLTPLALAERVRADLGPDADLLEVPGAGHFPLEEAPDVVVPAIAEFLRNGDPVPSRRGKQSAPEPVNPEVVAE